VGGFVLRRLQPHADDIIERYLNGASFEELGEEFNCASSTIRRLLLSREAPLRARERKKQVSVSREIMLQCFYKHISDKEI
jgi:DNA-directed RNA polymerase specialized sigma24 family protein